MYDLRNRKLTYINKQIKKFLGYSDHEIYEMDKEATCLIIHPEDHEKLRAAYKKLYKSRSKEYLEAEFRMKDKSGIYKFYLSKHRVFRLNDKGIPSQIIGSIQEITKRKEAEFKLLKTENLFKEAQNLAKIGNYEWNIEKNAFYWSEELYRIQEYQPDELRMNLKEYLRLIHPEDRRGCINILKKSRKKEKFQYEYRVIRKDGKIVHLYDEGRSIKDEKGKLIKISGYIQDITERKSFEEKLQKLNNHLEEIILERTTELRKSEERFRFLAECSPQIVWTADGNGIVDYTNEKWAIYSEKGVNFPLTEGSQNISHPDDIDKLSQEWKECIQEGKPFEIIHILKRNIDQMYRWHISRTIPLKNFHNSVVKWFGTTTDIHDYKIKWLRNP